MSQEFKDAAWVVLSVIVAVIMIVMVLAQISYSYQRGCCLCQRVIVDQTTTIVVTATPEGK